MGQRLKLGLAGCGDIAGYTALLSRLVPAVRITACCDVVPGRAAAFARRHNIPHSYTGYTEMLSTAGLDAVYLAVPHHLHLQMTQAALDRGLPVLVEKPLTRTLAEGLQLVESLRKCGGRVGVNYQYRYEHACHALARAVQNGALGRVHSARINVPWHREPAYFQEAAWHQRLAEAGGGTLITQGSHFLDIVLWALGERPRTAVGFTAKPGFDVEVETLAHGIIETESGALISITSSMAAARENAVQIEIYGDGGTAIYSSRPFPRLRFQGVSPHRQAPPGWGVHPLQRSLAGFARWVLADEPYLTPAVETLPVLAAVDAIYRSAQSGRRETIQDLRLDGAQ